MKLIINVAWPNAITHTLYIPEGLQTPPHPGTPHSSYT